jgi:hypothetical protein
LTDQTSFAVLTSNNGTIIPLVNTYLQSVCSSPACSNATIQNTTQQVLTSCATDLSNFGISQNIVEIVMNAYPTARKVVCLSTNSTMLSNSTTAGYNATSNSTLCPTALLDQFQTYLGVPLSTRYIQSIVLGGNATAYNTITNIANNKTIATKFACNDCVTAAVDVVLQDYPVLQNTTFSLGNSPLVANLTSSNSTSSNSTSSNSTSSKYTLGEFYQGLCQVPVGANISLPASIMETAVGVNLTSSMNSTSTSTASFSAASSGPTGMAARSAQEAKKRFIRWD